MYDDEQGELTRIRKLLQEISNKLSNIILILALIALGTFLAGRAAVLEKGFWALLGF